MPGRASAILGLVLAVLPGASRAQEIRFTQIVSTSTSIPGGAGGQPATFEYFRSAVIDGDRVVFSGEGPGNFSGLFLSTGGALQTIATSETPLPDGSGTFGRFFLMSIDGDTLAFMPGNVSGGSQGIFRSQGESFVKIVDGSTPVPGDSGLFTGLSEAVSVDDGRVLFHNWRSPSMAGLYIGDGSGIERFADTLTPPPGRPTPLAHFASPLFDDGNAAFIGYEPDVTGGVYLATPSQTFQLAKQGDLAPGAPWRFLLFGEVSIDGTDVAFRGSSDFLQNNSGIYFWSGGALTTIADHSTPVPGAPGRFDYFFTTSVSEGNVLFLARSADTWGLYVWSQGELIKVIRRGDTLGGQQVHGVSISPESFSGTRIVFQASTSAGWAVYVADLAPGDTAEIPTLSPAMLAFLVLGLAAAALVQLRRKGSLS